MSTDQQAFPCPVSISPLGDEHIAYPGMTLRDYFAAKCMPALLSQWQQNGGAIVATPVDLAARIAYDYADAMLKARDA